MFMDQGFQEFSGGVVINGLRYNENYGFIPDSSTMSGGFKLQPSAPVLDRNKYMSFQQYVPPSIIVPVQNGNQATASSGSPESDFAEESETLNYISRMLMEEDIDEKVNLYQEESAALRAAEKPFYDILGHKYPPLPDHQPFNSTYSLEASFYKIPSIKYRPSPDQQPLYSSYSLESPDDSSNDNYGPARSGGSYNSWGYASVEYQQLPMYPISVEYTPQSSFSSSNSAVNGLEPVEENLLGTSGLPAWQFRRGVEEARKFLPSDDKLVVDLEANGFSLPQLPKVEPRVVEVKAEEEDREHAIHESRGRKNLFREVLDEKEGRNTKQTAISFVDILRSDMFDQVLLCYEGKCKDMNALREKMRTEASKNSQSSQSKGSNGVKARGKKQPKKEVVDLRTLLIHCAQAVAADDRRSANELLKQIRQNSSPFGDGSQRLAHCFADGLEARLAGTGSQIYHSLMAKRTTASDTLKAYHLYLAACPFKRISHFVASQTILKVAEKASTIHIVDFGIYFGFQWPGLIQRLASRLGGAPKVRITAIDVPQPGFRPTERIEETGRRLEDYAKEFKVHFEYHSIASKWETIHVDDLKINKDEVLIVNCLYRFKNLVDETVVVDSPRNTVLKIIRKMNPDIFIHGIVNGSYSAPFFVTRFREALFHYSAMFDMLEINVPREHPQRLLIERDLFGRDALNVIACEGSERVERPETYKQWQVRNLRAGFQQLPISPDLMQKARDRVKGSYHKDFVFDEDSRWLLQGWKGRIMYALSIWKPS